MMQMRARRRFYAICRCLGPAYDHRIFSLIPLGLRREGHDGGLPGHTRLTLYPFALSASRTGLK
jgi:hypothetical protein